METGNPKRLLDPAKLTELLGLQKLPAKERKLVLTALLLVGVGLGFMWWSGGTESPPPASGPERPVKGPVLLETAGEAWTESRLDREVAAVLAQIKGAGRVVVDLHLATTEESVWLYREERQERATPAERGGETRELTIRREPVFQRKSGGEEAPVLSGKKAPVITGVLVVAEGAADPVIQRQLAEAAAVLLGVALHRVIVLPWG